MTDSLIDFSVPRGYRLVRVSAADDATLAALERTWAQQSASCTPPSRPSWSRSALAAIRPAERSAGTSPTRSSS